MTAKIVEFPYRGYAARLSAVQENGQWFPMASLYYGVELKRSTTPFPTESEAVEHARQYIIYYADQYQWKEDFCAKTDELMMGDTDWEFETHEQDWASQEWEVREGRTGAEHAQKVFDESPETKALYSPGGDRYEHKVNGIDPLRTKKA